MSKEIGRIHHLNILIGDKTQAKKIISDNLNILKISPIANPDVIETAHDTLNIEDSREIANFNLIKSFSGNLKVRIIFANFITLEAQNALLKVFEEPSEGTYFFVVIPQDSLLPTLRSRAYIKLLKNEKPKELERSILKIPLGQRINFIKDLVQSISDGEKSRQEAISLLNNIEFEIYSDDIKNNYERLLICQKTRASLLQRGAPVKMILENLVLSI